MATKKKRDVAAASTSRTGLALAAGDNAAGASGVKKGFASTPDLDLAFALGFPNLRYLTETDEEDPAATAAEIIETSDAWSAMLAWPRATASAYVLAVAACDNEAWRDHAGAITAEHAHAMMVERMDFGSVPDRFTQPTSIQLLEALVGTAPVVSGMIDGLERRFRAAPETTDDSYGEVAAYQLGYLLLRLPSTESDSARRRLEASLVACTARGNDDDMRSALRVVLGGKAGAEEAGYRPDGEDTAISPFFLGHVTSDARFVADHVERGGPPDVSSWPDARLAFLGGPPVLAWMKKHWSKHKAKGAHRYIIDTFGEIRSPVVRAMITEMKGTSKAKKEAAAWLAAHPE